MRLGELESALGARNPADAQQVIKRLVHAVQGVSDANQNQTQVIQDLVDQNQNQAQALQQIKTTLQAIIAWGRTVTPPFGG